MVKSLGADEVIDYKNQDYSTRSRKFDIVFDAVGKTSKAVAKKVLRKEGVFVSVEMLTSEKLDDLIELKKMAEEGTLKPFIDRTYTLDQIVQAHEYVDTGRKKGNLVIRVS